MKNTIIVLLLSISILFFGCVQTGDTSELKKVDQTSIQSIKQLPEAPVAIQTYSCPDGSNVTDLSSCPKKTCSDGTEYDECSLDKPKVCLNGELVNNVSLCGCNEGYDVSYITNTCVLHIYKCDDGTIYDGCSISKPKECVNGALIDNSVKCGCSKGYEISGLSCKLSDIYETTDSVYSVNGLQFNVELKEKGDSISYNTKSGGTGKLNAQNGKKLLKFNLVITSLDETPFFISSMILMDKEGNTYKSICPSALLTGCLNDDNLESMFDPLPSQKESGILIYSIPDNIQNVYLVYKFDTYSTPKAVKFLFEV
jgi:hypothetical protein